MPSNFKKSIRGLLASVRSSVMDAPGASLNDAVQRILSHQTPLGWANSAFSIIVKSSDGPLILSALQNDIRIHKAGHYKRRTRMLFKDVVEHEFVIVHLRFGGKEILLRIDRSVGPRKYSTNKDTEKKPEVASNSCSSNTDSHVSPPGSSSSVPSSTSSIGSILMFPSILVNYCVCRLSSITSPDRWARDTIVTIHKPPSDSYELTTIEYTGSSSEWPSLWDFVHLIEFIHQQCENYDTFDAQCYWFADTISALLEGWGKNARVTHHHGWKGIRSKVLSIPAPGTLKGVPIYKRDAVIIQTTKDGLARCIKLATQSTLEYLDMRGGGDMRVRRMQAEVVESAEVMVREAEERAREAEERAEAKAEAKVREAEERAEAKAEAKVREAEERAEARAEAKVRDAEERAKRAEARALKAEERADTMANSVNTHLKVERDARLKSEAQIQELSTELRHSQEVLKTFETRASHSDALMARIMARLDDPQSWHGPSVTV